MNDALEDAEAEREAAASASGAPARPAPAPDYGAFAPHALARVGLAIGRALPRGQAGLKLAGAVRPLALSGVKSGVADVEALGLKLRLHPKDNLSEKRLFMTPQCFDPDELEALRAVMGPGRTFADIGANAGAYSLVAAKAGGSACRVLAVEPQREMRRRLAYNARINGLSNIEITGVALSDYEGEGVMRLVAGNLGQTRFAGRARGDGEAVRVTTLLTLLDEHGVTRADAIKIDAEGSERRILSAFYAAAPRERWPHRVLLEKFDVQGEAGDEDPAPQLIKRGYAIERESRRNYVLRGPDAPEAVPA